MSIGRRITTVGMSIGNRRVLKVRKNSKNLLPGRKKSRLRHHPERKSRVERQGELVLVVGDDAHLHELPYAEQLCVERAMFKQKRCQKGAERPDS